MIEHPIAICGFPESGKTTYLAALWHLVTARTENTVLKFESLRNGNVAHLNALAARWRDGLTQLRTEIPSSQLVSMNLVDSDGTPLRLTFPDLSGESYRVMFEERDCAPGVAEILSRGGGMLFFIHADKIKQPHMVVNVVAQSNALGSAMTPGQEVPWSPRLSPTQVQIVDLLQLFRLPPLLLRLQKIAIVLSAWDKVEEEGRTPEEVLAEKLPLLDQYLRSGSDSWIWRVYGISAQGADYEKENEKLTEIQSAKLRELRTMDEPSKRISVVTNGSRTSDLTEPLAWLMG